MSWITHPHVIPNLEDFCSSSHLHYFNNALTTFLGLECVSCFTVYEVQKALRFHLKYLHLCSKDEQRSYGFGTTCGWVIHDSFWTIPLRLQNSVLLGVPRKAKSIIGVERFHILLLNFGIDFLILLGAQKHSLCLKTHLFSHVFT